MNNFYDMIKKYCHILLSVTFLFISVSVYSQTEVMAWGNITGIRVDGQLMEFESSLRVAGTEWSAINATGKERQRPRYDREGDTQTVTTEVGSIKFTESVTESGAGIALVSITATATKDTVIQGAFFCISLPEKYYSSASASFITGSGKSKEEKLSSLWVKQKANEARGISVKSELRQLEISSSEPVSIYIRKDGRGEDCTVWFTLMSQEIVSGQGVQKDFTVKATGTINRSPVEIVIDTHNPGRKFAGFGGNFRLQNPGTDPQVIQYCLDNMRVAWGRVEMPWSMWHPDEDTDPVEAALAGKLNKHVYESMQMAQKLTKLGIPVIISDWSAPAWAIVGDPMDAFRYRNKGIYGYPLNPDKTEKIYKSIADYIGYMKRYYGVEPEMFSFNESDLGINVRHTGEEHAEFIKGFGAYLASRGLSTKLLLGDNSDATTYGFILPALNDPATHKYIGAVSFHSWRGCDDETLKRWAGAAEYLNLPLIVGEGSTDAAAWTYPEIFNEQTFAMYEINLYIRICALCQPLSILQWQLTADYSVMTGAGIFGTEGPLHPTRRFWNLRQLASTPEDAFALPYTCDNEQLTCAVFGNIARHQYAVHMVNNGAERKSVISGLPGKIAALDVYVTNGEKGMEKTGEIQVSEGKAEVILPPASFITLISK